jgi:hypothetical protein
MENAGSARVTGPHSAWLPVREDGPATPPGGRLPLGGMSGPAMSREKSCRKSDVGAIRVYQGTSDSPSQIEDFALFPAQSCASFPCFQIDRG